MNGYQITLSRTKTGATKASRWGTGFSASSTNWVFAAPAFIRAARVSVVAVGYTQRIFSSLPISPSRCLSP